MSHTKQIQIFMMLFCLRSLWSSILPDIIKQASWKLVQVICKPDVAIAKGILVLQINSLAGLKSWRSLKSTVVHSILQSWVVFTRSCGTIKWTESSWAYIVPHVPLCDLCDFYETNFWTVVYQKIFWKCHYWKSFSMFI